jgi:hypothetical protein
MKGRKMKRIIHVGAGDVDAKQFRARSFASSYFTAWS